MKRSNLPLKALRAFEAAARHLSFAKAAKELSVTPTAISHQIATLEDILGFELFVRRNGKLALSDTARGSLPNLTDGLNKLEQVMDDLLGNGARAKLIVGVTSSFGSLWLVPRLRRFLEADPEIDVRIKYVLRAEDCYRYDVDVCISGLSDFPNRRVEMFMEEEVVPVAAPSLMQRVTSDTLDNARIIDFDWAILGMPTWDEYFREAGRTGGARRVALSVDHTLFAVEAAINGYGVLLGRTRLLAGALRTGTLVRTGDKVYPHRFPFYAVSKDGSEYSRNFVDWLHREAEEEEHIALSSPSALHTLPDFPGRQTMIL